MVMGNKVIMKPKTKVHLFLVLRTKEWKKMQLTKFKLSSFLGIPSIYQYCSQDCWRGDEHAWNEIPRLVHRTLRIILAQLCLQLKLMHTSTVVGNHRKCLIQNCERSELCLHFEWTKANQKSQK